MLSSLLETVCRSLSDSNQIVRSAGLFALGQFSEYLQVRRMKTIEAFIAGVCLQFHIYAGIHGVRSF